MPEATRCVACGDIGRPVGIVTLKALLKPAALERLAPGDYHFCSSSDCPVVYFGPATFSREDLGVAVFQKDVEGRRTVCYCLDITEDQLRAEARTTGHSKSAKRIRELIGNDRCACELRNPQGSCCLGNVEGLVTSVRMGSST